MTDSSMPEAIFVHEPTTEDPWLYTTASDLIRVCKESDVNGAVYIRADRHDELLRVAETMKEALCYYMKNAVDNYDEDEGVAQKALAAFERRKKS